MNMYGRGEPLTVYRGSHFRQKGRGLGSFFGSFFRRLIPLAKEYVLPAAKQYLLPAAKSTLKNMTMDILEGGRPIGETLKARSMEGIKAAGRNFINQSGSGTSRKRKRAKRANKQSKKRKGAGIKKVVKKRKSKKSKTKKRFRGLFD